MTRRPHCSGSGLKHPRSRHSKILLQSGCRCYPIPIRRTLGVKFGWGRDCCSHCLRPHLCRCSKSDPTLLLAIPFLVSVPSILTPPMLPPAPAFPLLESPEREVPPAPPAPPAPDVCVIAPPFPPAPPALTASVMQARTPASRVVRMVITKKRSSNESDQK